MKTSSHSSPDRSVLVGIAKWFTLAIAATLALALGQSAQAQMVLINPTTLNGSFEGSSGYFVNGAVTNWAVWGSIVGGPSTASNNSGAAQFIGNANLLPTQGTYAAYFQPGNADYDLTSYAIQGGETITYSFDNDAVAGRGLGGTLSVTAGLAYLNPTNGHIVAIAGSTINDGVGQTTTTFSFVIPFGASYVGDLLAFTLDNSVLQNNFPGVDNVILSVVPASGPPTNPVPVLLRSSDGVVPGQSFKIYGEGIFPAGVAMAPDATGQSPAVPPANAIYPAIIQTDKDGHFVVARMPSGTVPGVYNVWVTNQYSQSWSSCLKLNVARALFMSDYQAYNGLDIEVVGRNFDQSEFGGATATQVRLNNGGGTTYNMPIKDLNPYHVTFTVGNQSLGTYFVEVSNDNGTNWSRLASGQTLTLLAVPPGNYDPLGLGVSWASNFNWTNVFNVTNYGVNTNGTGDVTAQVQSAENAAENAGGGVVYFPNGSYYIKNISLGAGVVLEGQDEYNTKIYYNGTSGGVFINSKGTGSLGGIPQLQGVARMSILLSNPTNTNYRPDIFIKLGDQGASETANRLFVTGVYLNYPYTNGDSLGSDSHRGYGLIWTGQERVLVKDNHFSGWSGTVPITFLNQYCMLKNNYFEYSCGYVHDTATYLFYENNHVKIHPEYGQDSHGYFGRSDAYMAGNYVEGAGGAGGTNNDGEGYCVEAPGGDFNYGAVVSATSNSLTVAPVVSLTTPVLQYGYLAVVITLGTGLGQMEPVASLNANTGVITLAQPFTVVPDATSKFSLYAPLAYFTVYSNTLVNCGSGILPYGNQYDGVIANNTSIDSFGVFMYSARSGPPHSSTASDASGQFVRITRNSVTGISRFSNSSGIGLYTGRFDSPNFYDIEIYGTEITDNTVCGNNTLVPALIPGVALAPYGGIYISSYPYSTLSNGTGTGDATGTLMESNLLSNLPVGFTLTQCNYGQLVNANTYDNSVLTLMSNYTGSADNTIITSNVLVSGTVLPAITTQPQSQSVLVGESPTFTVLAAGTPAPYYQWLSNSTPIGGAHSASYTVSPVALGNSGTQYSVMVSNSAGSVTSSNAVLTVYATPVAPVITSQPQGQTVSIGFSATFTVGAAALPSPSYQWQTNGVNIPGACSASYTTPLLTASNNGTLFSCLVANSAGSTNSVSVMLGVVDPTPILAAGAMSGNGQFQLLLQGAPGQVYAIQASTNLTTTNWVLLSFFTLTNTSEYFLDSNSSNLSQCYYRAILLP